MSKHRFNFVFGDDQLNPLGQLPPGHVLECPTDWLSNKKLESTDIIVLLVMLAYATPNLDVQISKMQVARVRGLAKKTVAAAFKRLTRLHYIRKLPTRNGFIPVFRLYPEPYKMKKTKSKKSNVLK